MFLFALAAYDLTCSPYCMYQYRSKVSYQSRLDENRVARYENPVARESLKRQFLA